MSQSWEGVSQSWLSYISVMSQSQGSHVEVMHWPWIGQMSIKAGVQSASESGMGSCVSVMDQSWVSHGSVMGQSWVSHGSVMGQSWVGHVSLMGLFEAYHMSVMR